MFTNAYMHASWHLHLHLLISPSLKFPADDFQNFLFLKRSELLTCTLDFLAFTDWRFLGKEGLGMRTEENGGLN